jgi:hypothetical protein
VGENTPSPTADHSPERPNISEKREPLPGTDEATKQPDKTKGFRACGGGPPSGGVVWCPGAGKDDQDEMTHHRW